MTTSKPASRTTKPRGSRVPPTSDARPLGTKVVTMHPRAAKKSSPETQKVVDNITSPAASSSSTEFDTSSVSTGTNAPLTKERIMSAITLTLDPKPRKSTSVVFRLTNGLRGSVRIAKTAFPGGVPPAELVLQSDNDNAFAVAKSRLSAEERKAARKVAPKLTPAEKLAQLQKRAAALQAKIDAAAAAGATA